MWYDIKPFELILQRYDWKATNIHFSADGTAVSGHGSAVGTLPVTSYKVEVIGQLVFVGLRPKTGNKGYFMYIYNGKVYTGIGTGAKSYTSLSPYTNTIEVVYDKPNAEITFVVNDSSRGVAFNNVPEQDLFP